MMFSSINWNLYHHYIIYYLHEHVYQNAHDNTHTIQQYTTGRNKYIYHYNYNYIGICYYIEASE